MVDVSKRRSLTAQQFGDHSWLCGLSKRPELNGRHVILREWLQKDQRWSCEPVGWSSQNGMVSIRPKNLSNEPPPPTSKPTPPASSPTAVSAIKLMELVEREGQLRASAHVSPEARLRHLLCQRDLLAIQAEILSHRSDTALAMQARSQLEKHERDLLPVLRRWQAAGGEPVDVWEDDE